jgi:hypothetical protein
MALIPLICRPSFFDTRLWIVLAAAALLLLQAAVNEPNLSTDGVNLRIDTPNGQGSVIIDGILDLKVGHMNQAQLKVCQIE